MTPSRPRRSRRAEEADVRVGAAGLTGVWRAGSLWGWHGAPLKSIAEDRPGLWRKMLREAYGEQSLWVHGELGVRDVPGSGLAGACGPDACAVNTASQGHRRACPSTRFCRRPRGCKAGRTSCLVLPGDGVTAPSPEQGHGGDGVERKLLCDRGTW